VTGEESMFWNDTLVRCDLVHSSDDPSTHREPRCRLWVDRSGRVLKQESMMLGSKLVFLRRSDAEAEDLIASVGPLPEGGQPAVVEQRVGEGSAEKAEQETP
jgi:hypothetical protein